MQALRMMLIMLSFFLLISLVFADMPASFYQAMGNVKTEDTLCVKNYDAGASVTESYKDFEHLDKETEVVSRSYNTFNNEKFIQLWSNSTLGSVSLNWLPCS